ncbi:MAG: hypothetical protein ACXVW5_32955 [Solirubrobacteraceae bacterium]
MREFESCPGICRERKLELVRRDEYDEVADAAAACRFRIGALLPVVDELASVAPRRGEWRERYESVRQRGRMALRAAGHPTRETVDDEAWSAETTVVWRCPDCGGLDAAQPCIGVCIWRPLEWVAAGAFETERAQALRDLELEHSLFTLVARFARVTPRDGEWERNWRAFQRQARIVMGR